jgi:hypothetical protein
MYLIIHIYLESGEEKEKLCTGIITAFALAASLKDI